MAGKNDEFKKKFQGKGIRNSRHFETSTSNWFSRYFSKNVLAYQNG